MLLRLCLLLSMLRNPYNHETLTELRDLDLPDSCAVPGPLPMFCARPCSLYEALV